MAGQADVLPMSSGLFYESGLASDFFMKLGSMRVGHRPLGVVCYDASRHASAIVA